MNVQNAVDGCARVAALIPGIKRAYSSTASGQAGIFPIPQDVSDAPVAIVRQAGGRTAERGTPDVTHLLVSVELWVSSVSAGTADKEMAPLITGALDAFRSHVRLFGNAFTGKVVEWTEAVDVVSNLKNYIVVTVTIDVTTLEPATYEPGPTS